MAKKIGEIVDKRTLTEVGVGGTVGAGATLAGIDVVKGAQENELNAQDAIKEAEKHLAAARNAPGLTLESAENSYKHLAEQAALMHAKWNDATDWVPSWQQVQDADNKAAAALGIDQRDAAQFSSSIRTDLLHKIDAAKAAHNPQLAHQLSQELCKFNDDPKFHVDLLNQYIHSEHIAVDQAQNAVTAAQNDAHNILKNTVAGFQHLGNDIKTGVENAGGGLKDAAENVGGGLHDAIQNAAQTVGGHPVETAVVVGGALAGAAVTKIASKTGFADKLIKNREAAKQQAETEQHGPQHTRRT